MKNIVKMIVLLVALSINSITFGAHVNKTTAQTMATTVAIRGGNHLKSASVLSLVYAKENAFYVFGNESSFVIVAADDRVTPILGYSNEGPFVVPAANDSTGNTFWGMLNSYEQQIDYVITNNIAATTAIATQWENLKSGNTLKSATTVVPPLLTTNWNQGWPYNALCPSDPKGPGGHVWAGCVATAMAQILKYHNYPNQGLGSYGYQSGNYPNTTANFGATTYNWVNMPNSISTPNNDVATLIYQTAVAVRSTWGPGDAGTGITYQPIVDPITRAFVNYFKCAFSTIKFVESKNYTSEQWNNLLQTELTNKRPIYYGGEGSNGGHAWVCDGVDASNLYHFNWGWGGTNNGYFPLTAITPGTHDYNNKQIAIIGIQPNDGSTLVTNTSWSGSVNNLTNIAVPDAVTLTVNAGTVVKFAKDTKLQIFGKILSTGTSSNYTMFTAMDTTTGWWGIKFDNTYMNSEVMLDNDTSRFIYTQIQYSDMSGISIKNFNKVVIDHCTINNNYIDKNENGYDGPYGCGAGVFASNSKVKITNSKVYKNSATISGGGLYVDGGDNSITNICGNEIFRNFASKGGGFYLCNNFVFLNNIIYENHSSSGAGGAFIGTANPSEMTVFHNKFCNNVALSFGGGLYIENCNPQVVNNLIANNLSGNSTFGKGGAIQCTQNSSPRFLNNTIVNNVSYQGGALNINLNYAGIVTFKNCIIYGNSAINSGNQIVLAQTDADPVFDHCIIQGGVNAFAGLGSGSNYTIANYTNNIDVNPLFVSPTTGAGNGYDGMAANWQLLPTSPCINAGDVTGIATLLPTTDLAGNSRINGIVDMGAYEFFCTSVQTPNQPVGPDTVHSKTTPTSVYTTTAVPTADSYTWEIIPSNAGSLSGFITSSVTVTWNITYVGSVQIRVKATNACGSSQYSLVKNTYVDLSTAINEVEQSNIKVFPNPCDGRFTISSDKEISALFMYDVSGRIVTFNAPILGTTVAVGCTHLPKGIYVVHAYLRDTQQRIIQKVVIK